MTKKVLTYDEDVPPLQPRKRTPLTDVPTSSDQQEILKLFEAFERRVLLKHKCMRNLGKPFGRLLEKSTDPIIESPGQQFGRCYTEDTSKNWKQLPVV
ncbi:hypothetical protein AOLI_G00266990 [Acnodon oligacanthus]